MLQLFIVVSIHRSCRCFVVDKTNAGYIGEFLTDLEQVHSMVFLPPYPSTSSLT